MNETLRDILELLRTRATPLDAEELARLIRLRNKNVRDTSQHLSKKKLLDAFFALKEEQPALWESWDVDAALEQRLLATLRLKPRRTASGVATVTVITKPHACTSACLYCPNDVRMPKSYLADEPACQRAERVWFDPYLQVISRLHTLARMGHVTDKVELIVLGGTWDDYPQAYRIWFVAELFRALNDAGTPQAAEQVARRRAFYERCGILSDPQALEQATATTQARVTAGEVPFNRAIETLYGTNPRWQAASRIQSATFAQIEALHLRNQTASSRCVGLVIETRPDMVTLERLVLMRRLGCTKIQMGVQSLDDAVLRANHRTIGVQRIARAFALARLVGLKIHAHFMTNLFAATPEGDLRGYECLVRDRAFMPDEVKVYPCALIESTALMAHYRDGSWHPYDEDTLVDLLARIVLATPPWTRISRMIRDFSSDDIVDGNKKVNLREAVEAEACQRSQIKNQPIAEIRHREINTRSARAEELFLDEVTYQTSVGREVFLQWVTAEGVIAGFLRLSLPDAASVRTVIDAEGDDAPPGPWSATSAEAMIREVHIYGAVAALHATSDGAQHLGLGRRLIERACAIAGAAGYAHINVISAVGTREYYRKLGFYLAHDNLYQQRSLRMLAT